MAEEHISFKKGWREKGMHKPLSPDNNGDHEGKLLGGGEMEKGGVTPNRHSILNHLLRGGETP